MTPLKRAVQVLGTPTKAAEAIGVSIQNLNHWHARGVPAEACPVIERETRMAGQPVLCEELRPDIAWWVLRQPLGKKLKPPKD